MDFDYFDGQGDTAVDHPNVQQNAPAQDEDEFDFGGTHILT